MHVLKQLLFVISFVLLFIHTVSLVSAQQSQSSPQRETRFEAVVTTIEESKEIEVNGEKQPYQKLSVLVTQGEKKGERIVIETGTVPTVVSTTYKVGDKVLITVSAEGQGKPGYYISDVIRYDALLWLFGIFLVLTVLIGGKRGALSFLSLLLSFGIIFLFLLPQIAAGHDPILMAILASVGIIPLMFYLSHGVNAKTTIAMIGTFIALIITGILANVFVDLARLTGFASEEAAFLETIKQGSVNIRDLLLAGIIIGVLGVLDDITIAQSALVFQLKKASSQLSLRELFMRGMDVGRDHIASMVNTLILVYTGAALPLLVLFINNPQPFAQVINYEVIAEEIVRTLVASIGLILAIPITTLLASVYNDIYGQPEVLGKKK